MTILRKLKARRRKGGPKEYTFIVRVGITFAGTTETDAKDITIKAQNGRLLLVDALGVAYNVLRRHANAGGHNTPFMSLSLIGVTDPAGNWWSNTKLNTDLAKFYKKFK